MRFASAKSSRTLHTAMVKAEVRLRDGLLAGEALRGSDEGDAWCLTSRRQKDARRRMPAEEFLQKQVYLCMFLCMYICMYERIYVWARCGECLRRSSGKTMCVFVCGYAFYL